MCLWRLFKKMFQDPRNFQFSSDYPIPYFTYYVVKKIYAPANQTTLVEFSHDLGYIPMLDGYWSEYEDFRDTNVLLQSALFSNETVWNIQASDEEVTVNVWNGTNTDKTIYVKLWGFAPPDYYGPASSVSDSTRFNFDTDYTYLELFKAGVAENPTNTVVIEHNLGYVPQCKVWMKYHNDGKDWIALAPSTNAEYYGGVWHYTGAYADRKNVYLEPIVGGWSLYYHIYTSEGDVL